MRKTVCTLALSAFAFLFASTCLGQTAVFAADVKKGKSFYQMRCFGCHSLDQNRRGVGPHFRQLFGRVVGSVPEFSYTTALKDIGKEKVVWSSDNMANFLKDPEGFVRRWSMGRAKHSVMCRRSGKKEKIDAPNSSFELWKTIDCAVPISLQDLDDLKAYLATQ